MTSDVVTSLYILPNSLSLEHEMNAFASNINIDFLFYYILYQKLKSIYFYNVTDKLLIFVFYLFLNLLGSYLIFNIFIQKQ